MNRLSSKFEIEILSKYNISRLGDMYFYNSKGVYYHILDETISGIALKEILNLNAGFELYKYKQEYVIENEKLSFSHEDYNACIAKAINSIWKD